MSPQSQTETRACVGCSQQDGDVQQQEADPLLLPQLTRFHEAYLVWGEDVSNVATIPSQYRVTQQFLRRWQPFKDLKQTFVVSRRAEQLRQHVHQRVVATVEDSPLLTEMENLDSEEEDTSRWVLWYKPMSWLGQLRNLYNHSQKSHTVNHLAF